LIFKAQFEAVLIAFDALKDGLPDSWPYFWKVIVPGTLGAIVQSFDTVLKQVGNWCYVEPQLDAVNGQQMNLSLALHLAYSPDLFPSPLHTG
jgi:hypothetical protein